MSPSSEFTLARRIIEKKHRVFSRSTHTAALVTFSFSEFRRTKALERQQHVHSNPTKTTTTSTAAAAAGATQLAFIAARRCCRARLYERVSRSYIIIYTRKHIPGYRRLRPDDDDDVCKQ